MSTRKERAVIAAARNMADHWPLDENVRVSRKDMCEMFVRLNTALQRLDGEEHEWPHWLLGPEEGPGALT